MANPPELWAFILANTGVFLISGVLLGLSFVAYRQSHGQLSYRLAALGFGAVMLGGLVEPLYQLVVRGDTFVTQTELLWLQSSEGLLIAAGLGLLYVAIVRHTPASRGSAEGFEAVDELRYDSDWPEQDD